MTIAAFILAAGGAIMLITAVVSDLRHWRHTPTQHARTPDQPSRTRS